MDFLGNVTFGEFQWTEIIYAMAGSFVGIFIPLWIDRYKSRRQEKSARKKLLVSLNRELNSVKTLIEEYGKPDRRFDIFSFSTFVWDSVISSGMLTDMLTNKDIPGDLLMDIYADLSLLKELHDEFCQYSFHGDEEMIDDLKSLYASIMQTRRSIHNKITDYQNQFMKC